MLAQDHDPAFEKTGREDFTAAGEILMASGVTFRHFSARLDLEPPLFANLEQPGYTVPLHVHRCAV